MRKTADLLHASHVRLAYRALLGREPQPDEVRMQLAALTTTSELLSLLVNSAEFTGSARVLLSAPPTAPAALANIWHPELQQWTHPVGAPSPDEVAVVGKNGYFFLSGGTNSTLAQHTGELAMTDAWAPAWQALMEFRLADAEQRGLTAAFIIVPDKLAVQEADYPTPLEIMARRPALRLTEELGLPIVYPVDALRAAQAAEHAVYLRTDSHYTLHGNYVVHVALCEALGIDPFPETELANVPAYVASGDLGNRFSPPAVEVMRSFLSMRDAVIIEDNRDEVAATGGHVGSKRVFRNDTAPDERTLVMFGDSYGFSAEGYEGLSWFLAQLFREVHFVWVPFGWDGEYAERVGATVVVSQTAERFVARVPAQSVNADDVVAQAVADTGAAVNPDIVFDDRD
jgi:alginate O-acetyltransferase complex protein AlgJ